jgi:hypothetical protein
MSDSADALARALLTRAAAAEAARQAAREARDWPRVAQAEAELRELWRAYSDLEQRQRVA